MWQLTDLKTQYQNEEVMIFLTILTPDEQQSNKRCQLFSQKIQILSILVYVYCSLGGDDCDVQ